MLGGPQGPPGSGSPAVPRRLSEEAAQTADRGLVVAVIPAHNEEERIAVAIGSLAEQSSPPASILVCADNCTDGTAAAARAVGAAVFEPHGNEQGRHGALNQAFEAVLPVLHDDDAVLVMAADSVLADTFLAESRRRLGEGVGAVGVVHSPVDGAKALGPLQDEQYKILARDLPGLMEQSLVLTGRTTLFSSRALWHVLMARAAGLLPDGGTQVFDPSAADADAELTLALVHLGYRVVAAG